MYYDGNKIAQEIAVAIEPIKPEDRSGFLFALAIAPMINAKWSKQRIKDELIKGLEIAFSN